MVRDWFFYVVWFVRLKRLLLNYYCSEQLLEGKEIPISKEEVKKMVKEEDKKEKDGEEEGKQVRKTTVKL